MRRFSVLRVTFDWLTVILIMLAGSGVSMAIFSPTQVLKMGLLAGQRLLVIPLLPAPPMLPMAATAPISIA